ncbi:MFS transporter [Streptomyces sp. NPDC052225]|uniref:MFS transporter n=1 Tax=Streptomyces sp. NPDC052225 TaxID=3154949 RepID=UPI0034408B41
MRSPHAGTLQSLSVRNFRLFAAGQLVSVAGTWMMVVAQDWLVLSLTGDSGTALGVVTALQFAPLLLLTLYAGGLADRHDKRRLLMAANVASGVLSLLLAVLVLTGTAGLWHICLFALGLGIVNAVEVPTRMSFVSELVGGDLLPNASALSAAYFNVARVAGPALAGLLIGRFGTAPVMLLNAGSYLATVAALRAMRPAELYRSAQRPARARVMDGVRHMAARPDLRHAMVLVAVVGMLGFNFQLTLPLLAKTEFHAGAAEFGLLTTAFAAGSLLAAFLTTRRRGRPPAAVVVGAALAAGALECAAGLAPTYLWAAVLLFGTGCGCLYFAQAANHHIQLGTDPAYRGRVMALYTLVFQGTTPLGALVVGVLSERFGARSGLLAGGAATLLAACAVAVARLRARGPRPRTPDPIRISPGGTHDGHLADEPRPGPGRIGGGAHRHRPGGPRRLRP